MSSVGSYLRELRERRGVSLEEIARTTRVGRSYLEALEAGEFGKLPAPVFTRGFVVAYCQALGVSADEALTRFGGHAAAAVEAAAAAAPATARERSASRGRGPVLVSFVLLIVLGLALFAVALVLQSGREVDDRRAETRGVRREPLPPPPARAESTTTEAAATATTPSAVQAPVAPAPAAPVAPAVAAVNPPPAPAPATAVAAKDVLATPRPAAVTAPVTTTTPPAASATLSQQDATAALANVSAPYRLIARTSAPTWIRVRTDDGRVTDETVPAGQVREWVSNRPFTIAVGNAGGVRFELNSRPLPVLGPPGVVIGRLVLPAEAP